MCTLLPIIIDKLTLKAGQKTLLNNISLNITSSGILVIMGPNGAGKSLFMRCLHGLNQPDNGRILFAGNEINQTHRKSQAYIFQKPVLLKRSVRQNLEFVQTLHKTDKTASIELALRNVGLSKLARQPANQLSGGERQRLALARALMMRPQVLFLDEACANLDPASVSNIEAVLRQACKEGRKIILITHDIAQAKRLADEVVFLHHGALCEHTSAREFFQSPKSKAARAYIDGQVLV